MTTYRSAQEFETRFGDSPSEAERYISHCGAKFATHFDPQRLARLSEAIDRFTVNPAALSTPITLVGVRSDALVPFEQLERFAKALAGPKRLIPLDSPYGHDAFLKEPAQFARLIEGVLS